MPKDKPQIIKFAEPPDQEVIRALSSLLAQANRGEIGGLAWAAVPRNGTARWGWKAGQTIQMHHLMGALGALVTDYGGWVVEHSREVEEEPDNKDREEQEEQEEQE